jgi:hypothetical protein
VVMNITSCSYHINNSVSNSSNETSLTKEPELSHWTSRYIEEQLYVEMCEKEVEDPHGSYGNRISKYYLGAAKYVCRISAGNFEGENVKYKPIFEIHAKDFTSRLHAELKLLRKRSPDTLKQVVQNSVFRIFRARHKIIFFDYIQAEGLNWRFVED